MIEKTLKRQIVNTSLRMDLKVKKSLKMIAIENDRSMNSQIIHYIVSGLRKDLKERGFSDFFDNC